MLDERRNFDSGSDISHLVEGMKTEHSNEGVERSVDAGTDQARDLINSEVLDFNTTFPNIDIVNKEQMLAIEEYIGGVYKRDAEAGKELIKLLNSKTAEQLPAVQNQEAIDFVNQMASNLEGMAGEELDSGIAKARSAHA